MSNWSAYAPKRVYDVRAADEGVWVTIGGHPVLIDKDEMQAHLEKMLHTDEGGPKVIIGTGFMAMNTAGHFAENFERLPEDVKESYRNWNVVHEVGFYGENGDIAGTYSPRGQTIEFFSASTERLPEGHFGLEDGKGEGSWAREVYTHELGHAVAMASMGSEAHPGLHADSAFANAQSDFGERFYDSNSAWVTGKQETMNISHGFPPSDYGMKNSKEDFAESWSLHHIAPEGLRNASPERSEFMSRMVERVNAFNKETIEDKVARNEAKK